MNEDYSQHLAKLAKRYRDATENLRRAREDLTIGIWEATKDGMRQADIIRATDHVWTREQIRRVLATVIERPS